MSSEFRVIGTSQVIANLATLERELLRGASVALQEVVLEVAANAKRDAPVDLGELRQSINSEVNTSKLEGKVSANAKHAPYIEFGTGGMVEIPEGFSDMAATFRGKGVRQVNLPARPFLIPNANKGVKLLELKLAKLLR